MGEQNGWRRGGQRQRIPGGRGRNISGGGGGGGGRSDATARRFEPRSKAKARETAEKLTSATAAWCAVEANNHKRCCLDSRVGIAPVHHHNHTRTTTHTRTPRTPRTPPHAHTMRAGAPYVRRGTRSHGTRNHGSRNHGTPALHPQPRPQPRPIPSAASGQRSAFRQHAASGWPGKEGAKEGKEGAKEGKEG